MDAAIQPIMHGTALHNKVLCGPNINSAEVENPCSGCWLFSHLGIRKVSLRELSNLSKAVQVELGLEPRSERQRYFHSATRMGSMDVAHSLISKVWTLLHLISIFKMNLGPVAFGLLMTVCERGAMLGMGAVFTNSAYHHLSPLFTFITERRKKETKKTSHVKSVINSIILCTGLLEI